MAGSTSPSCARAAACASKLPTLASSPHSFLRGSAGASQCVMLRIQARQYRTCRSKEAASRFQQPTGRPDEDVCGYSAHLLSALTGQLLVQPTA